MILKVSFIRDDKAGISAIQDTHFGRPGTALGSMRTSHLDVVWTAPHYVSLQGGEVAGLFPVGSCKQWSSQEQTLV
jgi:hypothetical protein